MTLARALKVHLRRFDVHGLPLRVVTLRPQTTTRFSTNYFHDTWHVLSGPDGAVLLGELLWGLAFQRRPGTLVLLDAPHVVSTPFDGDAGDPILLIPDHLTHLHDDHLRALARALRRVPTPRTTIRWHSFGLRAALARDDRRDHLWLRHDEHRALRTRERMSRRAGFVCYTAPPEILRSQGLGIYRMHSHSAGTYHPLAERGARGAWHLDGEYQLIPGFADKVSAAAVARREVMDDPARALVDDAERHGVQVHTDATLARLHRARKRATSRRAT
ncbi:MAG TPA: hypothetical protein VK932_28100 [Kofleriaceae bacterium]|nr:hypothetical protein [Kofleriaceae bacterium]